VRAHKIFEKSEFFFIKKFERLVFQFCSYLSSYLDQETVGSSQAPRGVVVIEGNDVLIP